MTWLYKWRMTLLEQSLRKHLKFHASRQPVNWDNIRSVLLLGEIRQPEDQAVLDRLARDMQAHGKTVRTRYFAWDNAKDSPHLCFRKTDWLMRPAEAEYKPFESKPFDLILNLAGDQNPVLHFLAAAIPARMKVARYTGNMNSFYDLQIGTPQRKPEQLYQESLSLLTKINQHELVPAL